jgi:transposase
MIREKTNTYTAEFRAATVKLANESDKSVAQVAEDQGINAYTLHTCGKYNRRQAPDNPTRTDDHLYDELKRLKKQVAPLISQNVTGFATLTEPFENIKHTFD